MSSWISILCALASGGSIVVARSINALLAEHIGTLPSSFFNYATGLLTSCFFLLGFGFSSLQKLPQITEHIQLIFLLGGVIGVVNIILLNRVVAHIPPLQLTLIIFVAQLGSSMLLDYFLLDLFSIQKLIGGLLVLAGLLLDTYTSKSQSKNAAQ